MSRLARLRRRAAAAPAATDAVLAVALWAIVSFGATTTAEVEHASGSLLGALLDAVLVAPLVLRRRRPREVLAACAAASLIVVFSFGAVGGEIATLVALATLAAREPDPRPLAAAIGATLLATLVVALVLADGEPERVVAPVAAAVAAAAVGLAARARRAELEALADRASQAAGLAVAAERARIARELHDIVAHNVTVMVALADGADHTLDLDREQAREAVRSVASTGREALEELRGLLGLLRDADSAEPAAHAPQPGVAQLDELLVRVRDAGVAARLRVEGAPTPISPVAELTLYRIAQEALTNVLRHAREPTSVDVRLAWSRDAVTLEIVDDGHTAPDRVHAGRGLTGMVERAALHGAGLSAGSRATGGWRVATRLPLADPPAGAAS
jgi:signal transduction histidine kinase